MDTKGVGRPTAAVLDPYKTGSAAQARATAACPNRLHKARRRLLRRVYAASTSGPPRSRLKVTKRLAKLSGHPFRPATQKALQDVSACLPSKPATPGPKAWRR